MFFYFMPVTPARSSSCYLVIRRDNISLNSALAVKQKLQSWSCNFWAKSNTYVILFYTSYFTLFLFYYFVFQLQVGVKGCLLVAEKTENFEDVLKLHERYNGSFVECKLPVNEKGSISHSLSCVLPPFYHVATLSCGRLALSNFLTFLVCKLSVMLLHGHS